MSKFFNSSTKALDSFLNNKAGEALNRIPTGARNVLGTIFPGLGGGIPGVRSGNVFLAAQNTNREARAGQGLFAEPTDLVGSSEVSRSYDWRARLRPKDAGATSFYGDSQILAPIAASHGLIWQYTPGIFLNATADYRSENLHGSNFPIRTFNHTTIDSFTVTGTFSANTIAEGKYMLSALHFLRMATRAHFGETNAALAGTPPPVMLFEYMGELGFNAVPVVVTSWNWTLSPDVDYVPVELEGKVTYVPIELDIQTTLSVMVNPVRARKNYNLENIKSGTGYKGFI